MIIKQAKYKNVRRIVKECVSPEVYGCDFCKKVIGNDKDGYAHTLQITVFWNNKEAEHKVLCSWKCAFGFLKTAKTDYFIGLPYLTFDEKKKGLTVKDFRAELKKEK